MTTKADCSQTATNRNILDAINALHDTVKGAIAKLGTVEPAVLEAKTWEPPVVNVVMDVKATNAALQHYFDTTRAHDSVWSAMSNQNDRLMRQLDEVGNLYNEMRKRAEDAEGKASSLELTAKEWQRRAKDAEAKIHAMHVTQDARLTAANNKISDMARELNERRTELVLVMEGSHKNTLKLIDTEKKLKAAEALLDKQALENVRAWERADSYAQALKPFIDGYGHVSSYDMDQAHRVSAGKPYVKKPSSFDYD